MQHASMPEVATSADMKFSLSLVGLPEGSFRTCCVSGVEKVLSMLYFHILQLMLLFTEEIRVLYLDMWRLTIIIKTFNINNKIVVNLNNKILLLIRIRQGKIDYVNYSILFDIIEFYFVMTTYEAAIFAF